MPVGLTSGVFWVGVTDWGLRRFHGHELSTHRGSSYNAYLIRDEKTVLVDTVWGPFAGQFIENLRQAVDLSRIDVVVANHSELDHAGALGEVMRLCPRAELVVSKRGAQSIEGHFHQNWKVRAVGTGDRIPIGRDELVFVEAPLLHWPDSMFTYLTGRNVLMPNDAFGQHYATGRRFNDQVNQEELFEEALKYYVNILTPFSDRVLQKIDELLAMKVPVDVIAPSHGVIWRQDPLQIVRKYQEWAAQKPQASAAVLFDTMWNGTRRMGEAIGDGLTDAGVDHKLLPMAVTDRNDALVDVFKARTIVIGSPTLNNGLLPTIWPILIDLKGLKFKNKLGAAFGSYGWSGEGVAIIEKHLADCGIPVVQPGIRCKWQPSADDLQACRAFGRQIGQATRQGT